MSLKDEMPEGPTSYQGFLVVLFSVILLVIAMMLLMSSCSHSMSSKIGNKDQNVSFGISLEVSHSKEKNE